jgi:hypothetical protein
MGMNRTITKGFPAIISSIKASMNKNQTHEQNLKKLVSNLNQFFKLHAKIHEKYRA